MRKDGNSQRGRDTEESLNIAREVDKIADEHGVSSTQVALAWILSRRYQFIPIVGARKVSQIEDSIGAVDVDLSDENLAHLNELT